MKVYKSEKLNKRTLKEIANELKNGKTAVFPTDTIYGIGTNAFCLAGVKKLYKLKGRTDKKPLPILVDDISKIKNIVKKIPTGAAKLVKRFWPGPLTLVFETNELGCILTGGRKNIAVRIPDNEVLLSIIKEMTCPLIGTSANISGKKVCRHVSDLDKKILKNVDIIIDGGIVKWGKPSTVLDVSKFPYIVLREGCISKKKIEKFMKT
ncbi:MAG: threonylcarbamoyl-AMP synthase [Elusimicrobia bacterium CG06_land_8_20_14_3_00_38_11]|nr:MAG: threonylcarbamoyl-AMP synthase [Elusimicrobia bacterium CG06_land_8_20_14_3_00_38_11]